MNERIRQLAEESGITDNNLSDGNMSHNDLKKFAELIVTECAELIIETGTDWVDFAPNKTGVRSEYWAMAQQIKQHFGVEE